MNARKFVALDDHEAASALNKAMLVALREPRPLTAVDLLGALNEADVVLVRDVPA